MNHRPRTTLSSLALRLTAASLLSVVSAPSAFAQAAAAAPVAITGAMKSAPDAATAATYKATIDLYVQQQVAKLSDTKAPAAMKRAREALEQAAAGQTSSAYLQVYAAAIDANVGKLASSKDLVTRLNGAIVVSRVAARAQNAALVPSATKFMNDPQDAVALWGVKSAKSLIPVVLSLNGATPDTLTPGLLNVVKRHWYSGPIAYEAYDALRLSVAAPAGAALAPVGAAPPAGDAAIKAVVQPMLGLMAFRADLYAKGVPPQPGAENAPIQFLTQSKVWPLLTDVQRLALVQQIVAVTGCAGQHANADVSNDVRGTLAKMIQTAGSGVQVIGENAITKDPSTVEAGKALRQISEATPGPVIADTTAAAFTTLSASPKWKGLKPAPTIAEPGKILSPNEPLDDGGEAAPATAGGAAPANTGVQ